MNLTASTITGATYSWTGPNSFTSTSQNPSIATITTAGAGTYSVTATVNGCTSVAGTTSVTVNAIPSTPTAGNNGALCAGSTLNLTASTITGATYAWTGPNSFTSTSQNPSIANITTAGAGTYSVLATLNGCTSVAGTTSVTVNAIPSTPTAGNNGALCAGSTLNLTASTITGATYAWTGPNSFTSTSQNPSIANITTAGAGTYSVTATVNGCTSVAGTTSVTVNNYPTNVSISASATTVTSGTSVTLTASGATNYNWDNGLGTGAVKTVTPTSSTTYTVIADNGNSCKDTTSITIDVTNSSNTGVTTSTVTIGTGTATDYSIPLQSYFNYGWSSQLYLASELQGGGFLNSLSFYVTNSGASYTLDNQKIYVRHTTDASFADKNYPGTTGFTLVYDGPITISSTGWKTIPFSTPFNYNGTSNLEVLVESRDGSTFTSAIQTRYTNQSGTSIYRTKYDYNNDAFPSTYYQGGRIHHYANIQFNKTVCNLNAGIISSSKNSTCIGDSLTLKLLNQTINQNIQWQISTDSVNYVDIINQNSTTYTILNITIPGYYRVRLGNGVCNINTTPIHIQVKKVPSRPLIYVNSPVCEGDLAAFNFTSTDSLATYELKKPDGSVLTTNTLENVLTSDSGIYSVISKIDGCFSSPATTNLMVNPKAKVGFIQNNSVQLSIDDKVELKLSSNLSNAVLEWQSSSDNIIFSKVSDIPDSNQQFVLTDEIMFFRVKYTLGSCVSYTDTLLVKASVTEGTTKIIVNDRILGNSKGSLDRVIAKAVDKANAGYDVQVLFHLEPDENGSTNYYLNSPIQSVSYSSGKITFGKAPNAEGRQGIEFGSYYDNPMLLNDFWGDAWIDFSCFNTKTNFSTSSLYYSLKRKVDAGYYLIDPTQNILPLSYFNYSATSKYTYKIYSSSRDLLKQSEIELHPGKNNFIIDLNVHLIPGYYTLEMTNEKGELYYCKFYTKFIIYPPIDFPGCDSPFDFYPINYKVWRGQYQYE